MPSTNDDPAHAATAFARRLAASVDDRLGPRLLGSYLIGSLAHGGFGPRYSDIDILLLAEGGLAPEELAWVRERATALSEAHAAKLSIFWSDRGLTIGRFPPLDRIDYLDHAVRLTEREAIRPERPSLAEVRAYLAGTPFERWAATAQAFAAGDRLDRKDHKPYLRAHLYPARLAYSWLTGSIASNDVAVAFLKENAPLGLDVGLIEEALRIRREGRDPDDLFPARVRLPQQVDACAILIARSPATAP